MEGGTYSEPMHSDILATKARARTIIGVCLVNLNSLPHSTSSAR